MHPNDKPAFADALSMLCGVFQRNASPELVAGYWKALEKMPIGGFEWACEQAAGQCETMPRPAKLWEIHRSRRRGQLSAQVLQDQTPDFDSYHAFGQRCLMVFLRTRGPATPDSLGRLVDTKNRLVREFRDIATECEVPAEEVRESLFSAFGREWEAA